MTESIAEDTFRSMLSNYVSFHYNAQADLKALNDKAIELASGFFPELPTNRVVQIASDLANALHTKLELGATVRDEDTYVPWLETRKSDVDLVRGKAYSRLLTQRGWGKSVVRSLDQQTDELVELMGDPRDESSWSRKGLAIGEVQSGKTATYIGVLNKALDLGYQIIVVIGGHTEDLRRQTQERLDRDLIGDDTSYLNEVVANPRDNKIGIGEIIPEINTNSLTSARYDFNITTVKSTTVKLGSGNPTIFVVKKNSTVLKSLAKYIRNSAPGNRHTAPIAVIDDESDWASVNTSAKEGERTAVNRAILDLLDVSQRSSYLGITATPFANILIADDKETKDLFPKDYIVALESPSNYKGVESYFPSDERTGPEIRTEIDDFHSILPQKHKKDDYVGLLAPSLKRAILSFYVSTAIRYKRESAQVPSSMMVNVSRFNNIQSRINELVTDFVKSVNEQIVASAGLFDLSTGRTSPVIDDLARVLLSQFPDVEYDLADLGDAFLEVASSIQVELVNGLTMKERNEKIESWTSTRLSDWKKRPAIYVGGNVLARGLTLDGLVTSYFTRKASAADTLLQMGRWFGYRPHYEDLTRVWMDAEVVGHFRYVAEVSRELRDSVAEMHDRTLTPRDFGLKIRLHPESFLITAANKQRAGTKKSYSGIFSYRGGAFETHMVPVSSELNAQNRASVDSLLADLVDTTKQEPIRSTKNGPLCWYNVPHTLVQKFLTNFYVNRSLPKSKVFGSGGLTPSGITAVGQEQGWTVGFVSGDGDPVNESGVVGVLPGPINYSIRNSVTLEKGETELHLGQRRVATSSNISSALTVEERQRASANSKKSKSGKLTQQGAIQHGLRSPMLLVYLISVSSDIDEAGTRPSDDPEVGESGKRGRLALKGLGSVPALVLATPPLSEDEEKDNLASGGKKFGIQYIVNSVYARLELGIGEPDDDEDEV